MVEWPARPSTSKRHVGRKVYSSACGRFQIVHFAGAGSSKRFACYVRNVISGEFSPAIEDFNTLDQAKACCGQIAEGVKICQRRGIYFVKIWRVCQSGNGGWIFLDADGHRTRGEAVEAMRTYLESKRGAA